MNWYMAKIVFRIVCGEGNHQPQFDEQLRLIAADSQQEANEKAQNIGLREQNGFLNQDKQWVNWQFIGVSELSWLGDLKDGAELYYSITEPANANEYISFVQEKASRISRDTAHTTPMSAIKSTL